MLLWGILIALGLERFQGGNQPRPRIARIDDVVDIAPRRRHVRIRELGGVLVDTLIRRRLGISALADLLPKETVDRAVGHATLRSPRMCLELMTS